MFLLVTLLFFFVPFVDMAMLLLSKGSDVNDLNAFNSTPLHHAVLSGHLDVVTFFLKNGANVDMKDKRGYSPLAIAVENNNYEMCRKIIRSNATVDSKAIELAKKSNNKEIRRLLGLEEVN